MGEKIGSGLKIFILDDEKDICHFSKEFFVKRGFDVHTALTGKSAINLLKKVQPDIAILDIRLSRSEINGLDVLEFIRGKRPACQCIIISYVDDQKLIDQAMVMGAIDYLKKPLTLVEIERAINKVVRKIRKGGK